jgi:hypothetical protein
MIRPATFAGTVAALSLLACTAFAGGVNNKEWKAIGYDKAAQVRFAKDAKHTLRDAGIKAKFSPKFGDGKGPLLGPIQITVKNAKSAAKAFQLLADKGDHGNVEWKSSKGRPNVISSHFGRAGQIQFSVGTKKGLGGLSANEADD